MFDDDDPMDDIDMSVFSPEQQAMLGNIEKAFSHMGHTRIIMRNQIRDAWDEVDETNMAFDRVLATLSFHQICPDCGACRDEMHTTESCEAGADKVSAWVGDLNDILTDYRQIDRDEIKGSWRTLLKQMADIMTEDLTANSEWEGE